MELEGTVGIVTGASRGIGVYLVDALAGKGVNLALAARSKDELEVVAEKARARGVKAIALPTDISDRHQLAELVGRTRDELGPVDLLVNNAGLELAGYSEKVDLEHIATVVNLNLTSLIQLTRLVLPEMMERRRGHVCNIASMAGKVARPYGTVYAATKHGVVGFSWSLRAEMAAHGVEVSVVCPSYVSEAGMFATRVAGMNLGKPPSMLKPVTPQKVAAETIRSIERNRAEVAVAAPLLRIADVIHAISPDFAIGMGRRGGTHRYVKKEATGD